MDFVFDGLKGNYVEEDVVNLLSVYVCLKVEVEDLLIGSDYMNWFVVCIIIVYGIGYYFFCFNMILWVFEVFLKGDIMKLVNDQF